MSNNNLINFNFKEELVFILGGSGLIGTEVSKQLAELGAKVINLDIKNNIIKNDSIIFEKFDCSKVDTIEKMLLKIFKKYGCPKIFINCSYPKTKDWINNNFDLVKYSSYKKNLEIHLNSYTWSTKIIINQMKKQKIEGKIILLSSIYGQVAQDSKLYNKTNLSPNMTYSVIKGGIISLSRQMASNYGKYNIRVNSVSPGGIIDKKISSNSKSSKLFRSNYINRVPLERFAKPEEIAGPIIFLASDSASYITGINLLVDGGWTSI